MRCGRTYRGGFAANRVAEVAFRWHSGDWTMVKGVTCAREGERGSRAREGEGGLGGHHKGWGHNVGDGGGVLVAQGKGKEEGLH